MAGVALHASPSSELFCGALSRSNAGSRWKECGQVKPSSTFFSSPAALGIGAVGERSILICCDSSQVGSIRTKNSNGDVEKFLSSWGWKCCKSEVRRMDFITGGLGDKASESPSPGRSRETAKDALIERSKNGLKFTNFFVDQEDEDAKVDSFPRNPILRDPDSAERKDWNLMPDIDDSEEQQSANADTTGQRQSRSLQRAQLDEDIWFSGRENGNAREVEKDYTSRQSNPTVTARRENKMVGDRATDAESYDENLDKEELGGGRIRFLRFGRVPTIDKTEIASSNVMDQQTQRPDLENLDTASGNLGISGRDMDGTLGSERQLDFNFPSVGLENLGVELGDNGQTEVGAKVREIERGDTEGPLGSGRRLESTFASLDPEDEGQTEGGVKVQEIERGRSSSTEEDLANIEGYVGPRDETQQVLSLKKDLQGRRMDQQRSEELRQSSSQRPPELFPYTIADRQNSKSAWKLEEDYDASSRRGLLIDGRESDTDGRNWNAGSGPANAKPTYQTDRNGEVSGFSGIGDDEEIVRSVVERESTGSNTSLIRANRVEPELEVLARGTVYAKQVISLETAQALGVVTQLWVDLESLKVVALEVRPSLLFGDSEGILLESVNKVGDVVLIHDETLYLDELNLSNCSDLVGIDILTENGYYLGKVRDYIFSLGDGELVSLEFDTFGVPFIPSSVISTYSLTVDEVVEAQDDGVLVRIGAEKRVQKLTKGLFPRLRKAYIGRKFESAGTRNRAPKPTVSRRSYKESPDLQYTNVSTAQKRRNVDGFAEPNYTPRVYNLKNQESSRGSIKTVSRTVTGEPLETNLFEEDTDQSNYSDSELNSGVEDFRYEQQDDVTREANSRDMSGEFNSVILDNRESQSSTADKLGLPSSLPEKGLPMSFRTTKRRK